MPGGTTSIQYLCLEDRETHPTPPKSNYPFIRYVRGLTHNLDFDSGFETAKHNFTRTFNQLKDSENDASFLQKIEKAWNSCVRFINGEIPSQEFIPKDQLETVIAGKNPAGHAPLPKYQLHINRLKSAMFINLQPWVVDKENNKILPFESVSLWEDAQFNRKCVSDHNLYCMLAPPLDFFYNTFNDLDINSLPTELAEENKNQLTDLLKNFSEQLQQAVTLATEEEKAILEQAAHVVLKRLCIKNEDYNNERQTRYAEIAHSLRGHASPAFQGVGTLMLLISAALLTVGILAATSVLSLGTIPMACAFAGSGAALVISGLSFWNGRQKGLSKMMSDIDDTLHLSAPKN